MVLRLLSSAGSRLCLPVSLIASVLLAIFMLPAGSLQAEAIVEGHAKLEQKDSGQPAAEKPAKPLNVVFILADDLGWRDLGCFGSKAYETPELDKLATGGMRFTNAYATCPVCSPSRASIMTGKDPARLGLTAHIGDAQPGHWRRPTPLKPAPYVGNLDHKETTLAEQFHNAGYATFHAGKWHLGGEHHYPEYQGFDVNIGGWSQGGPFGGKQYFSPYGNPRLADGPEGEHLPDRLANETCRFIEAHRFEPFFVHLSFYSVHVPLVAREDLKEKYAEKYSSEAYPADEMKETADGTERVRQDHVIYGAMIEAMDQAVGKVMATLEKTGLADNTLIVFTSDNGGLATGDVGISAAEGWPTTNTPLRAGKGWLYEGGIRVPLIVKGPGVASTGGVSEKVVTGSDYYPTVLELAQIKTEPGQAADGESFVTSLSGSQEQRKPAYWHYPHYGNQGGRPGGAIRDGDWKLIEWYGPDAENSQVELYNLADDLDETDDLASTLPSQRERLLTALRDYREKLNAKMPTANVTELANEPKDKADVKKDDSAREARAGGKAEARSR